MSRWDQNADEIATRIFMVPGFYHFISNSLLKHSEKPNIFEAGTVNRIEGEGGHYKCEARSRGQYKGKKNCPS